MLTLNQIVRKIKTIALAHLQVRNFYFGNVTDFLTDKTTRYASCFLQDNPGLPDLAGNVMTFNFTMYLLDLENVSEDTQANTLDVQSDMSQVCLDLLAQFNFSTYDDWRIVSSTLSLKREEFDDIVAGASVDFSVQVPWNKDTCVVPSGGELVNLYWSFFDNDPYGDIQNEDFEFSQQVTEGLGIYNLDFVLSGKYLAVKELATEPEKSTWRNTQFNYGVIPDQVWRDAVVIGAFRYYVSRIPVVLQDDNTIITFNV